MSELICPFMYKTFNNVCAHPTKNGLPNCDPWCKIPFLSPLSEQIYDFINAWPYPMFDELWAFEWNYGFKKLVDTILELSNKDKIKIEPIEYRTFYYDRLDWRKTWLEPL